MKVSPCAHVLALLIFLQVSGATDPSSTCRKCPPGWEARKPCTSPGNTVCRRCIRGRTYSPDEQSSCWQCSRCGIGLYVARRCTRTRDTVCDDCTAVINKPNTKRNSDFRVSCKYLYLKSG